VGRVRPLVRKPSKDLPKTVDITISQVDAWWDYWLLWRIAGKRIESFMALVGWYGPLSKSILDVFLELDNFYEKMETQMMEKEMESRKKHGRQS
jgi:hypothetical protein